VTLVYDLDYHHGLPLGELKSLVGGKAANLNVMAVDLALPVPPGFAITTAACNSYLANGWPEGLDEELRSHMARVESVVGRRFGDPADPLLVSVRSGAPVSMPGMMDTILNLGLNEATTSGLCDTAGDPRFANDCYRRFKEMYRNIVGTDAPEDPWLQLRGAIEAVFRSWNGERARAYRKHEGIPDDLGTAVTVQTMVFGNRSSDSGTGVLFTRSPSTGENTLYGDVMFNAQGEDVVAGTHQTEPVSVLDERMPEVGRELREYARRLERHYSDLCDIEFTIERARLWMLQVRVGKRTPQAALRLALEMAEDPEFPLSREEAVRRVAAQLANPPRTSVRREGGPAPLAVGLPASPGVACGEIVTSPDAAQAAAAAGHTVILVRSETSPDDVMGMEKSAGVLTARGGFASHAAVVARGWGIPAVVGAHAIEVREDGMSVDGRTFACGEIITIDGATGEVFAGRVAGSSEIMPDAATLLAWAHELGIAIGEAEASPAAASGATDAAAAETATTELSAGDVMRGLLVKGLVTADGLALTTGAPADELKPILDELVGKGLVEATAGAFRLTSEGKLAALDVFTADRERAGGEDVCVTALDGFLLLDARMKDTVTGWQLRTVGGEQTINDHSDAAYDASILAQLAALHADTCVWLAPITASLPRLAAYRARLDRAFEMAQGGDQRFVASPRVDSYHSVWFELHEDLIRLSGRRRSDEAAAGRA
jgi:pyruvate, orthophosphate dikinase